MLRPAKVLIVDDSAEDIALLSRTLQSAGYEVRSATEARSGLDAATAEKFDVILLDNRFDNSTMPGISAVHEFSQKCAAGVVLMTAFGNEDLEKDAKILGALAFLIKPVSSELLLGTVARLLEPRKPPSP